MPSPDDDTRLQLLSRDELETLVHDRTAELQNVMDTMVDVLLRLGPEGRIEMANEATETTLGYPPEAVEGRPIDTLFADPDDNDELSEMLTRGEFLDRLLGEGRVTDLEVYFRTADGDRVPMSLSASVLEGDDGVDGIVCVAKDISDRKQAEEYASFLHSVLRHDLGNYLQVIQSSLSILEPSMLESPHDEALDRAQRGLEGATDLIRKVRRLERVGSRQLEPIDLDDAVQAAVDRNAELAARADVTVDNEVATGRRVQADGLLDEVFANLIENAIEHSGGTRVRITATVHEETVTVSVADDGVGIPGDLRESLTERGVTGPNSDGSGLGTHLAARLTDEYGGELTPGESELGGGQFDVTLQRS